MNYWHDHTLRLPLREVAARYPKTYQKVGDQLREMGLTSEGKSWEESKKIVLKQRRGSGSRGVIILDNSIKKFKYLLPNRFMEKNQKTIAIKCLFGLGSIFYFNKLKNLSFGENDIDMIQLNNVKYLKRESKREIY